MPLNELRVKVKNLNKEAKPLGYALKLVKIDKPTTAKKPKVATVTYIGNSKKAGKTKNAPLEVVNNILNNEFRNNVAELKKHLKMFKEGQTITLKHVVVTPLKKEVQSK